MSDNQKIPFLDLVGLHQEIEKELVPIFQKALRTAGFIGGPMVEGFECDFARFCDAAHCVGVASGTDAVRFALMAAGVQPGDIVVTVPHTFIATTEAISQAGACADFVDIDERTYCMDPAKLQEYLERECYLDRETGKPFHRTRKAPVTAVIPVHIYGQTADMDRILELARRYRLMVIEDACQAHGAEYFSKKENRWRKAGSMGHAAAFSFYPGRIWAPVERLERSQRTTTRWRRKYACCAITVKRASTTMRSRVTTDGWMRSRRGSCKASYITSRRGIKSVVKLRAIYSELLGDVPTSLVLPFEPSWSRAVWHLYVVRTAQRNELQEHLTKGGIGTGIHYPVPVHLQKPYRAKGFKEGDFPVAERAAAQVLSLPMYPGLSLAQQNRVVAEISAVSKTSPRAQCPSSEW